MLESRLKSVLRRVMTLPLASSATTWLTRHAAAVLLLHRFGDPDHGVTGHSVATLRRLLSRLRRRRYNLLPLADLLALLHDRTPPPPKTVVFTVDDGYLGQAEIGAPVFMEFDCPVTIFLTTGFLDGQLWFWWDKIEYVFHHTSQRTVTVATPHGSRQYSLRSEASRSRATRDLVAACKRMRDAERRDTIGTLCTAAEVNPPEQPPPRYAPMPWSTVRSLEDKGIRFGPHSVSHPILAQVGDAKAHEEISVSWERLCTETRAPVPVFCYPNGRATDFTQREVQYLQALGFHGALTTIPGRASIPQQPSAFDLYRIPRYAFSDDLSVTLQYVNGLETAKEYLRRLPLTRRP